MSYPDLVLILFYLILSIQKLKFATIKEVKINKIVLRILQLFIFVGAVYIIYREFDKNQKTIDFSKVFQDINTAWGYTVLLVVFICQFLNWGLEALKFKKVISKTENISTFESIKAVYAGNAIGVLTPNKAGTFIGRALFLKNKDSVAVVSSTILGNISQLATTALFGIIGFIIILAYDTKLDFYSDNFPTLALLFSIALLILLFTLLFFPIILYRIVKRLPIVKKYGERVKYFEEIENKELRIILYLSIARYIVFAFQFYLLLLVSGLDISLVSFFAFICALYLIVTFIPSPFMGNLFTREAVVVVLLANFNSTSEVLIASFLLWIINIAFPAILGSVLFLLNKEKTVVEDK